MKICIQFEPEEFYSNIGFAKALTEMPALDVSDLYEIARYLAVFCDVANKDLPHSPGYEARNGGVLE